MDLPKIRRNPLVEILAINTGCLNHCTYCKTKMARGNLGSYSMDEIVKRCRQSFREGVKEIWMTSEDTGRQNLVKTRYTKQTCATLFLTMRSLNYELNRVPFLDVT